jgi:hypothetical protein
LPLRNFLALLELITLNSCPPSRTTLLSERMQGQPHAAHRSTTATYWLATWPWTSYIPLFLSISLGIKWRHYSVTYRNFERIKNEAFGFCFF